MHPKLWVWKVVAVFGWNSPHVAGGYRTAPRECQIIAGSHDQAINVMQQWWRATASDVHEETGDPINWRLIDVVELRRMQEVVTGDQVAKYLEEISNG